MQHYICPMHPNITSSKPSSCSICGMKLVEKSKLKAKSSSHDDSTDASYMPLIIVILLISLVTVANSIQALYLDTFSIESSMRVFMAGFFLVFSGFKLLDLKGFADGYATYDLIAKKFPFYGFIYPFLELTLGLLYMLGMDSTQLNLFTTILMTVSGLGVAIKLAKRESFQCACLGTFLKVPLTKVTLIEDFGMALMGILMLIL